MRERVDAARAAGGPTSDVPFRQTVRDLPRVQVPVGFPLYNLGSGRTHRAQARYIEEHELPDDFFADPESEDAQSAQHEILLGMIDEAKLKADLEQKEQRRPLVLTYDGFIVDGNRRTAALREAGETEQLTAIVLPEDALAADIYETELELQMAVETKATYNWVDEGLHVRHGILVLGEAKDAIARRMNRPEAEIDELLGRMALVDLYLDWLDKRGKYHRVGVEDEQSFIELRLRERRAQFRNLSQLHQRTVRNAVFAVIHVTGGYKDVRQVADSMIGQLAEVARRVREEQLPAEALQLLDRPVEVDTPAQAQSDVLSQLAEADVGPPPPAGVELLNILGSAPATDDVGVALIRVGEDLAELDREQREQGQPLRKLERALRALREVNLSQETPRREEIASTLAQIIARAEELSRRVDELHSQQPG